MGTTALGCGSSATLLVIFKTEESGVAPMRRWCDRAYIRKFKKRSLAQMLRADFGLCGGPDKEDSGSGCCKGKHLPLVQHHHP
jgi:hypothetical protein